MNEHPVISGKLIQGAKKAAFFTGLDWVKHQCKKKLGFIPFPGTLNLEITGADVQLLKNLNDSTWEELVPPDKNFVPQTSCLYLSVTSKGH